MEQGMTIAEMHKQIITIVAWSPRARHNNNIDPEDWIGVTALYIPEDDAWQTWVEFGPVTGGPPGNNNCDPLTVCDGDTLEGSYLTLLNTVVMLYGGV